MEEQGLHKIKFDNEHQQRHLDNNNDSSDNYLLLHRDVETAFDNGNVILFPIPYRYQRSATPTLQSPDDEHGSHSY